MPNPAWGASRLTRWWLRTVPMAIGSVVCCACCSKAVRPDAEATSAQAGEAVAATPVRVAQDEVILLGRWIPVGDRSGAQGVQDTVRVECRRARSLCDEELTHAATAHGAKPTQEKLTYRVQKWTKWGVPAGSLLACRHEGRVEVVIRVSLNGLAAEKAYIDHGAEARSRLE